MELYHCQATPHAQTIAERGFDRRQGYTQMREPDGTLVRGPSKRSNHGWVTQSKNSGACKFWFVGSDGKEHSLMQEDIGLPVHVKISDGSWQPLPVAPKVSNATSNIACIASFFFSGVYWISLLHSY